MDYYGNLDNETESSEQNIPEHAYAQQALKSPCSPAKRPVKKRKTSYGHVRPPVYHGFMFQVQQKLKAYKYRQALKLLVNKSPKAKEAVMHIVLNNCRREMSEFNKNAIYTTTLLNRSALETFSWEEFLTETKLNLPMLHTVVEGSLSKFSQQHHLKFGNGSIGRLVPALGLLIGMILFLKNRGKFKFLSAIMSVQLFRNGVTQKMLQWLNKARITMGVNGTRAAVDRINADFDRGAKDLKKSTEDFYATSHPVKRKLFEDDNKQSNGYSLTWDNVQKLSEARHHSTENRNKFRMWALAFLTENRIPEHTGIGEEGRVSAEEISLKTFLPNQDDIENLQKRMAILVQRILVENLPSLARMKEHVVQHIPHEFTAASKRKSNIINLGVIEENPASTKGVIRIMKTLKQYVPQKPDGSLIDIIVNGDQLSVERMVTARVTMSSSSVRENRFVGMEPNSQEFHKRCLILQDTMNELYDCKSGNEKGTLFQIRNKFGHGGVKKHVMDSVNHASDFLHFTTEAMVTLLAMKLLNMDEIDQIPESAQGNCDISVFLEEIGKKVVDFIWPHVYQSTITSATEDQVESTCVGASDEYDEYDDDGNNSICSCNSEGLSSSVTVECSASTQCTGARHYHLECVGLMELPEDDWWCSTDCEKHSLFCTCHLSRLTDEWLGCESGEMCIVALRGWFHLSCAGLQRMPPEDEEWFCSEECQAHFRKHTDEDEVKEYDHVNEYSCALTWHGLFQLAHTDTERENDGPAMLSLWKWDMLFFWKNHHPKYLILGHRLLSGVAGWVSKRLRHSLTWNRTANVTGGAGKNCALDLVNEFLNNDFKENLKHSHGNYTEKNITRLSRITGPVGKSLEDVFVRKVMSSTPLRSHSSKACHKTDVNLFIRTYKRACLFDQILGRGHKSFPNFRHVIMMRNPDQFRKRMVKYARKLDLEAYALSIA